MRIDYDYLSEILNEFLESENATLDWDSFNRLHEESMDKFIFHLRIMADKNLIVAFSGNDDLGITQEDGEYKIRSTPWRLTAGGHDFASAITKESVLITIKKKLKEEGFSAVIDIAKKLATKQAEKALGEHI